NSAPKTGRGIRGARGRTSFAGEPVAKADRIREMRFAFGALAALVATAAMPPAHIVVHFGHLWDGVKLLDEVNVTIDGATISSVDSGVKAPPDAVDMRSSTAIPGLIDLHTHITYYWDRKPGTRPLGQPRRRPAVTVYLAQENARRTLETGVTTI